MRIDPRNHSGKSPSHGAAHLTAQIENAQDLTWSVDLDFRLVTFNKALANEILKHCGVVAKPGMRPCDLLPPELARLWPPSFQRALEHGPFRAEYAFQDGRVMELTFSPIQAGETVVGISVFARDTTERKLAEEFLKTSEKRFRTLLDGAPMAIGFSRNGSILYVNFKYVEMFRLKSREEAIGRPVLSQWASESRASIEQLLRRPAEASRGIAFDGVAERPDGSRFPMHGEATAIVLPDGPAHFVFLSDVTQSKATEEALRESEARFRNYFDLPLVGFSIVHPEAPGIIANDRLCEMLGYTSEELRQLSWQQITHPDDLESNQVNFNRLVSGEIQRHCIEKRYIRKDGSTLWAEITLGCVRKSDGSVEHVCGYLQDIGKRKAAQEALRASEARLRSYFELPLVGMAITSLEQGFIAVNDRLCDILGYSRAELLRGTTRQVTYPDDLDADRDDFTRLLAGEIDTYSLEKRFVRKDGRIIWTAISVGCVRNSDQSVDYVCKIIEDISERRAAEDTIQKAEQKFREIFEDAPEGIFQTSPKGKSLALNPAGAKMLGYASSEEAVSAINNSAHDAWLDPLDRARYAALLEERGEVRDFPCRFKRKDGSWFWASVAARRICGADGQTAYYQGFMQDISERKRLESALQTKIRELQLFSEMNVALVTAENEPDLLTEYCRIMVETGGYRMAWVGFAESSPGKPVIPVAHFGHEEGYLSIANISWEEGERGRGVTGKAIRVGTIQLAEDFATSEDLTPWHDEALKRGYRSTIALPFRHSDGSSACLTAYGAELGAWSLSERKLLDGIARDLGYGITNLRTRAARNRNQEDLRASLEQTIQVIAETVDQRDPYTSGHGRRVADLCTHVARKLGLDKERVHGLHLAATIHDLGKIGIPAEILSKPGRLTPNQYALIREHAQLGYDILRNVRFPWPIADMVLQHHERMDGSGYPQHLVGDAILLESRILAVADVAEAMATHRPYRPARGVHTALDEILKGRGTLYDGAVVDACLRVFQEDSYTFPE